MPRLLEPGFGVQIETEDGAELDWRVAEVANEGIVLVGSSVTPAPGERVRIAWGSSKGAFTGTTRVLEAEEQSEDGLVQLYARIVVENPDHVKKEERRQFLRVPCTVPFEVVLDGRPVAGSSKDVSANGLRGMIRGSIPHVPVDVHLTLPFGQVVARGRIVRCRCLDQQGMSEIGVAFVAPDPRTEDRIVSFVLSRERELVRVRRE
jgi:c-di-GMP-binding flagellar brake protein YcgR